MDANAYGYANEKMAASQQHAAIGAAKSVAIPMSPVVRLGNAVETAEQTASMVHRMRVAMMGDIPEVPDAAALKEYLGEGLIGRIADAASRIERANNRIMRGLEDMTRAAGDF